VTQWIDRFLDLHLAFYLIAIPTTLIAFGFCASIYQAYRIKSVLDELKSIGWFESYKTFAVTNKMFWQKMPSGLPLFPLVATLLFKLLYLTSFLVAVGCCLQLVIMLTRP